MQSCTKVVIVILSSFCIIAIIYSFVVFYQGGRPFQWLLSSRKMSSSQRIEQNRRESIKRKKQVGNEEMKEERKRKEKTDKSKIEKNNRNRKEDLQSQKTKKIEKWKKMSEMRGEKRRKLILKKRKEKIEKKRVDMISKKASADKIEDVQNKQWQQKQDKLMINIQKTCEKYNLTANNGNYSTWVWMY